MSESTPSTPTQMRHQVRYAAPHWHSREVLRHISLMTAIALLPVAAAAACLFGLSSLTTIGVALLSAAFTEVVVRTLVNRNIDLKNGQTLIAAILLALSLPAQCGWDVVALGAALMVVFKELVGGGGHYLWHPMLISRALLAAAVPLSVTPDNYEVLKKDHLAIGRLASHEPITTNTNWYIRQGGADTQAWSGSAPVQTLSSLYRRPAETVPDALLVLIRDKMAPVSDCLLGTIGGCLGTTCKLAILLGGMFLIYRGYVRWTLPAGAIAGAILAASALPIADPQGVAVWWPVVITAPGQPALPLGMTMVLYHLAVGELLFATFFIASDMTASPLRTSGHWWFGLGIGVLTILLRSSGIVPGDTYWAILIMSTLVPAIDRLTRRRVYGT